ncbi:ribonuclease E/G [Pseudothioclava arenosa]|uniref:Ribonuclease G n=1 Tax=Pseudothioclava arenosa TaxID=1795308 RepID=A0A2A4CV39_9RHOB|nr:ribonuclease E/G [Pseudothioclava arenosa]PCD78132.1 ribonuclease G [Pseudothioclava arenosa]
MKGRSVILGQVAGREAAALMVDGELHDLLIDASDLVPLAPGAICRAKVGRQMKGQGGVFVDLPDGARGFLREVKGLAPGQTVIVEVTGGVEPGKALPVSLRVLFKSRLAIVTPGAPGLNVSRRIRDEDTRAALQALAGEVMDGCDFGLILRSACEHASETEIAEDIAAMRGLAEAVTADLEGPPELLVDAPGPHEEAWRDWADPAPDEVLEGDFAELGVLDAVAALTDPRVELQGGAHMMIEPTRALIAVDVNTGNDTSPAAALKANIAAARELPRQLRLRGLGGQIVIDFAPMPKRDRQVLEQQMRVSIKGEAESALAGWTPLGNFEMQRKRDRIARAPLLRGLE